MTASRARPPLPVANRASGLFPDRLCVVPVDQGGTRAYDLGPLRRNGIVPATVAAFNRGGRWGGPVLSHLATSALTNFNAAFGTFGYATPLVPTQNCTILLGYRKRDATFRASSAFGITDVGGDTSQCHATLPFSDGNVYWDFGGVTGSNRLTAAGLTFGDDVWAFTTGPRGMEIWQNGLLRASNASNPTRSDAGSFGLGTSRSVTSDLADFSFIYIYGRQLPVADVLRLSADPFIPVRPPERAAILSASIPPSSFSFAATLSGVALSASLTSTAPAPSAASLVATLADVSLTSSFTATAAGASSFTLAPTLAAATLSASLTATAPAASSFSLAATPADVALTSTFDTSLLTGLIAYYPLDEPSGDATDATGGGRTFIDHNGVGTAAGVLGTARSFDGVSQYLELPGGFGLGAVTGAPFSVTGWVWSDNLTGNHIIFGRGDVNGKIIQLWTGGSQFLVSYGPGPSYNSLFSPFITTGTWYHLAFTFSASGVGKLYLNASLAVTDSSPTGDFTSTAPLDLGRRGGDGDSPFAGRIDEMALWGRELSAAEVSFLFGGGTPPALSTFGGAATARLAVAATLADVSLAASLATTPPAASALAYAATLADVALDALLASAGPDPSSLALAAILADCTASLSLIAAGVVGNGKHPDHRRSTGVRLGLDPSRSTGTRIGPDPARSRGRRLGVDPSRSTGTLT